MQLSRMIFYYLGNNYLGDICSYLIHKSRSNSCSGRLVRFGLVLIYNCMKSVYYYRIDVGVYQWGNDILMYHKLFLEYNIEHKRLTYQQNKWVFLDQYYGFGNTL